MCCVCVFYIPGVCMLLGLCVLSVFSGMCVLVYSRCMGYSSGSHIAKSNSSHIAKISPNHCDVRQGLVFFA